MLFYLYELQLKKRTVEDAVPYKMFKTKKERHDVPLLFYFRLHKNTLSAVMRIFRENRSADEGETYKSTLSEETTIENENEFK